MATISVRSYLSTHHLYAARYAAEAAEELERKYAEPPSHFSIRHRGLVLSAIAESVMFLEAAINEVYQDASDELHSYVGQLDAGSLKLMAALWEATDSNRMRTLNKYDWVLKFCGHEPFDRSRSPYQPVALLIDLRNYLVRYRPENIGTGTESKLIKTLGDGLHGRFPDNALMPERDHNAP
ncbi:hypothetical protein [Lentzea flava]|uniref:Uncharacterized protein n=1 Tax=Lentzea flava TaxID=103732 RepID=A0ABQ2UNP7_9PSEU|nr:hypothetical protein [Lentzea flava]MCP2200963.1 hypothetical protein [Lentzea flava]GGU46789.1 hypothetical protein GCM10010178_44010 [Lentzea flava]